jgi:mannonate dehydratase
MTVIVTNMPLYQVFGGKSRHGVLVYGHAIGKDLAETVDEVFSSIFGYQQLITEHLIDYIRTTILHAGSMRHLCKVAALAEIYHIKTGFHGATNLSLITMGYSLHFDTWVSNFGIQEYMPHTGQTNEVFPHDDHFAHRYLMIGDKPRRGTDINEALAAKYPDQRTYLPINRLEDGSMFN